VLVVRGRRVILPEGEHPASIHIDRGTFAAIGAYGESPVGADVLDVGDLVVSPGIVDTHVHVNEPGRTEWEGFDTATRAAAAGGVTTIVDMPLNSVPATTSVEGLSAKRTAARRQCHVDVAFWGGVVPDNHSELDALVDAGVRGFKCFLVPSGVDEFPAVDEADLRRALAVLAHHDVPLLVHAESPRVIDDVARAFQARDERGPERAALHSVYISYLATRPPAAEVDAIRLMVRLASEYGVRTHIVHVAAAEAVDEIARARASGVPITAETCPHYLTFTAEDVPDGDTAYKCAPPIRESRHRDTLWDGLRRGALDLVATDHSPAPPTLKCAGDFRRAWGGIASLELSLAATWTGARTRGFDPSDLARWMSAAPASLAGLADRKGAIAVGHDADLIVWDPNAVFTVDAATLQQRHKLTPYAGRRLSGVVRTTLIRGERVWADDRLVQPGCGQLL
jgi:allantoinase